jgi:hypothetical protein
LPSPNRAPPLIELARMFAQARARFGGAHHGDELAIGDVWARLIRTHRAAGRGAWVAVAYFSKGAARLLKLRKGSQLVVDASDNAVRGGLTCPDDLILLAKKGVRIFSVANVHTKVYVFGTTALIGSDQRLSASQRRVRHVAARSTRQLNSGGFNGGGWTGVGCQARLPGVTSSPTPSMM